MACGSRSGSSLNEVEVVQLPGQTANLDCSGLPAFPRSDNGILGMTDADGNPVLCGGDNGGLDPTGCTVLVDGSWIPASYSMRGRHQLGNAVKLTDGRYWLFGDASG